MICSTDYEMPEMICKQNEFVCGEQYIDLSQPSAPFVLSKEHYKILNVKRMKPGEVCTYQITMHKNNDIE